MEIFNDLPYDIQKIIYDHHVAKINYNKVIKEFIGVVDDMKHFFGVKLLFYESEINQIMDSDIFISDDEEEEENLSQYILNFLHDDLKDKDLFDDY